MRTILVGSALVLLGPALAGAQVACGDTIGKGQTVTLTADVGPCDNADINEIPLGFALKVDGGTLDLGGHTVTCADTDGNGLTPVGILLRGEKSQVMNGTVAGECFYGLDIGHDPYGEDKKFGKHRVERLTVKDSLVDGVLAWTPRTTLVDVTSTNARGDGNGFVIFGDRSKLVNLVATGNANRGIVIQSNKKSRLSGAVATGNAGDGIYVADEAKKIKLTACEGSGNGGSGIVIHGLRTTVKDSIANDNSSNGFALTNPQNRIRGGSAHGNGGFDLLNCKNNKVSGLDHTTESSDCL